MVSMNGAVSLIQTLINGGLEVCFTNPGTSEMHFVAALDKVEGMRTVLGLFEGVCTGAADGYARMTGKPAATLLHLGPGLGNGLANLHNARRANSPVVNIVGDHATYHLQYDPPLTTDIESMAKTVSGWVRTCNDASSVPRDASAAIAASLKPPGRVATLILPADCSWNESTAPFPAPEIPKPSSVDPGTIERIAAVLRKGGRSVMLMGDPFLMETPLWLAGRISRATNARLIANRVNSRLQRGAGRVAVDRLPYPVEPALKMLEGTKHLVLVGAKPPVSFFAWPNLPNWLTPDGCQIHTLATPEEDGVTALEMLAEAVHAPAEPHAADALKRPSLPTGKLTAENVWISLAALMPENSVISDEAVSSGRNADDWMAGAPPHDWLSLMGGAIGQGMPVASGAAVACPDRKVFSMQADGSAMYTLQSLWTQAHENLDIVTVLFANHSYKILMGELKRVGVAWACPKAENLFDLDNPRIDWVKLATGMGVHAERATTAEEFNGHLKEAIQTHGPHLIEVAL
jgi:acetolactate synthase-1/2/3 large subunit